MSSLIVSSPTRPPAVRDHAATDHADLDRGRETGRSWIWTVVEALAYAGASFDPTSALAAQRLARLRDEQLNHGRRH